MLILSNAAFFNFDTIRGATFFLRNDKKNRPGFRRGFRLGAYTHRNFYDICIHVKIFGFG